MKKVIFSAVLSLVVFCVGTAVFAQARSNGAGSALDWHEIKSAPQWVKNLDDYDWQFALNSSSMVINPGSVPRNVMELIDSQVGKGGNGMVWANDPSGFVDIYWRNNGRYIFITLSKRWFE
ncbi:MAG: hypothetical protein Ta2B_13970 [Termitinemataceae bacterium]|nr:MAG: hypothetical protein Ta2B_13970 [Termitinemataceae bacterium]